ncbi:MAG TPA: ABC transporter substrate-binding protein [Xanthobacteraceae bacterium]|jgi:NitT/TauT family transport system substrate-binding protein
MRKSAANRALLAAALIVAPSLANAESKLIVAMPTTPPNLVHMPIHIANDLGLFKKYGLEVKVIELAGGVYTFRAVVAGSADIASASGPFSIVGKAKGAPTRMILTNTPKLEASMVVNEDIKTMADLKGKRIGIQEPGGFADVLARGVLRAAKIDPKDVHFVSIATEDVPALIANQVDTAILHVEQEMVAKAKIPSLHAIARLWEIQPDNLYGVMATTEKTIADKHDAVAAFVKGHIEATRLIYTDRAKVVPIMVKYTKLPADVVNKALDFMVEKCIWNPNDGLSPKRVNFTAQLMTRVGNIDKDKTPKYEDLVDLSFAKDAIKQLGEYKGPCQSEE